MKVLAIRERMSPARWRFRIGNTLSQIFSILACFGERISSLPPPKDVSGWTKLPTVSLIFSNLPTGLYSFYRFYSFHAGRRRRFPHNWWDTFAYYRNGNSTMSFVSSSYVLHLSWMNVRGGRQGRSSQHTVTHKCTRWRHVLVPLPKRIFACRKYMQGIFGNKNFPTYQI